MAMSAIHKDISITRRGQEKFLLQELRNRLTKGQCNQVAPQVVEISGTSHEELAAFPLFFSAQFLPNAVFTTAESIKSWASAILNYVIATLGEETSSWCLHIFDPATAESGEIYSRPALIAKELRSLLKTKRRSLLRSLQETCSSGSTLIQVLLTTPNEGYLSVATLPTRALFGASISPVPAGFFPIADDKNPPSRAFKKLREAIQVFNLRMTPGQTAVDLGASPGGWSYVVAEHGVTVTAIDRSPLEGAVARDRRVTFVQGNAFTWRPSHPVDWLVCDVITTPDKTLTILKSWIDNKLCRNFCVTVKFKGDPDITALHAIASYLRSNTTYCDGRQLTHNKNELTVVGRTFSSHSD
jgi:23S rRNA C2498 (ribose-2'-O)-methylase RlmM